MANLPDEPSIGVYLLMLREDRVRSNLQDPQFFRAAITSLNKNRVFTLKELAQILGVKKSMISSWKKGKNIPVPALKTNIFDLIRKELLKKSADQEKEPS